MNLNESREIFRQKVLQEVPNLRLEQDLPMSQFTTLHLGGPADLLAEPSSIDEVSLLLRTASLCRLPVTVIGHGSNLLVLDGGIRGLVIRIAREMKQIRVENDLLIAQAGAMLSSAAMTAAEHSLSGLAFAGGIPGTVGGGVFMNAGAYGGEMSDVVVRVEGVDKDGLPFSYEGSEMGFSYRTSRLQKEDCIVTQVTCRLTGGDRDQILKDMAEMNRRRAEKQPLNLPSAGSTFRRPEGAFAAALIDQCQLKGFSVGGAQVSEKHAGFLVNRGGTAADFLDLMHHVQRVVYERTGYLLEPEVRILGEEPQG